MDKINAVLIIALVITCSIVGSMAYSEGYFDFLIPKPEISLIEISISPNILLCDVNFKLINTGSSDGFVIIDLTI